MAKAIDFKRLQKFAEKRLRGVGKVMMMTEEIAPIGLKQGDMSVWLWGGRAFDRAGREVSDEMPPWVLEGASKINKQKLEKAGWLDAVTKYAMEEKRNKQAKR